MVPVTTNQSINSNQKNKYGNQHCLPCCTMSAFFKHHFFGGKIRTLTPRWTTNIKICRPELSRIKCDQYLWCFVDMGHMNAWWVILGFNRSTNGPDRISRSPDFANHQHIPIEQGHQDWPPHALKHSCQCHASVSCAAGLPHFFDRYK